MTTRLEHDPQFFPNQAISVRELKRIADLAGRNERVSVSGDMDAVAGSWGISTARPSSPEWWICITAQSAGDRALYSWKSVQRLPDNSDWEDDPVGPIGEYSVTPATEANYNEDVPADGSFVARAWLGDDGQSVIFEYQAAGSAPVTYTNTVTYTGPTVYPKGGIVTLSGNTDNFPLPAPHGSVLAVNMGGPYKLTGIVAPTNPATLSTIDGYRITIVNLSGHVLTLPHEDAGSAAINRFLNIYAQDIMFPPNFWAELEYDALVASRWRVMWTSDMLTKGVTAPVLNVNWNDYPLDPTFSVHMFTVTVPNVNLTGIAASGGNKHGDRLTIFANGGTITLKHNDSGSNAINRFRCPSDLDWVISNPGGTDVIYDATDGVWFVDEVEVLYHGLNTVLVVGANGKAQEKAGFLANGNQIRVEERTGATRPEMAGLYAGSGNSDLAGSEYVQRFSGYGRVGGADQVLGGIDIKYTGTGTQPRGQTELFSVDDGGIKRIGMTVDRSGNTTLNNAATVDKLLGTDHTDGHTITVNIDSTLAYNPSTQTLSVSGTGTAALANTQIGVGNGSGFLSGSSTFVRALGFVTQQDDTNGASGWRADVFSAIGGSVPTFAGRRARGTIGSPTDTADGDELVSFGGYRAIGGGFVSGPSASIVVVAENTDTARLVVRTAAHTSLTQTDRISVYNDGTVKVHNLTASQLVATDASNKLTSLSGVNASTFPVSNLTTSMFAANVVDDDTTLAANSATRIPTQHAVKTYIGTVISGMLDFKGSTDCSGNPNYPAAVKGDAYVVSVAGRIGGASGTQVDVGDWYIAEADNAGGTEAAVGSSWGHIEHNLVGALLSANNLSDLASVSTARGNLGGTTVGQNLFTLANPGAITFLRVNADNSVSALDAATFRTAIGAGTASGTVTSVATGAGLTGGPITGSGTISVAAIIPQAETIKLTNATTAAVDTVFTVAHASSGTPGNAFGSRTAWDLDSSFNIQTTGFSVDVSWAAGVGLTRARTVLSTWGGGSPAEVIRMEHNGTDGSLSFYGVAAVARQSSPDAGTGLVNLGLFSGTPSWNTTNLAGTLSRAQLANGNATSVIGRSANTSGVTADIGASADWQVLFRNGSSVLGFGLIDARSQNTIGASVYPSANYTLANATYTALACNTELFNTNSLHSTVTNNSRITVPTGMAGKWFLLAIVGGFLSTGAGQAIAEFGPAKNGSFVADLACAAGVVTMACDVTTAVAGDYFELIEKQNSGASQTMLASGSLYPRLVAVYLGA